MCEWLSRREWCDVQLLCGGRTFRAHRAVLASVSAFLRKILLSNPTEESPTSILLPDYDLEAMSSVLYYVYNGEVIVPKNKLEMFLDIIKAMQIYIDHQYLTKMFSGVEKEFCTSDVSNQICDMAEKRNFEYGHFYKREQIENMFQQYSIHDLVLRGKVDYSQDWSAPHRPLANLQSYYEDRQRNSFLRDLFVETYPRNGNGNGRPAGVLAIANERYRDPASGLLMNANGKHHRDNLLSDKTNFISQSTDCITLKAGKHPENTAQSLMLNGNFKPLINTISSQSYTNFNNYLDLSTTPLQNAFLSNQFMPMNSDTKKDMKETVLLRKVRTSHHTLMKSAILNQVLDSPWSTRVPNNKPLRKKDEIRVTPTDSNDATSLNRNSIVNDDNNNVEGMKAFEDSESETIRADISNLSIPRDDLPEHKDFKCTFCTQIFPDQESLSVHTRCHSTARYTCNECSKSFSQLRNFKYHMSVHRGTREFAATCTVCGKYFNDRGYLSSHMKIHRNRKEYKCSQCPKSFNQRVAYNMHVRIHTGIKPHVCPDCGKAFSRKMLLKQHQRTHSGERPYACSHCDKRFADRSNMTLHLRLHTGIKPFLCTLCPKSFTKKHHLKSHLNFHTGAKPYSCPRCKLAFTQSSNMRTHLKKCNAPLPESSAPVSS